MGDAVKGQSTNEGVNRLWKEAAHDVGAACYVEFEKTLGILDEDGDRFVSDITAAIGEFALR